jgi:hypothetical protein
VGVALIIAANTETGMLKGSAIFNVHYKILIILAGLYQEASARENATG